MPLSHYITSPGNIFYLTGFQGSNAFIILADRKIHLFTDQRYLSEAKVLIPKKKNNFSIQIHDLKDKLENKLAKIFKKEKISEINFESNHLKFNEYKKLSKFIKKTQKDFKLTNIKLKPNPDFIEKMRLIKKPDEIEKIKKAQNIAKKVLTEIKKELKPGISEMEIAFKIEFMGRKLGAENISFPPIVAFGKNTSIPHHLCDNTKLKNNDIVLLDFGFEYQGYCSDMTRTLFTKTPSEKQKKVYETVLKAQNEAIKNIKPGITGQKADSIARKIIEKAGFKDNFTHSTGHGVGIDIHELPNLSPNFKKKKNIKLQENMVVTVEPGIYIENEFGVRIEDMILITKNGNLNLTKAKKFTFN